MKLAIIGSGTMGRIVADMARQNPGIDQVSVIEPALGEELDDIAQPDVIIDFSHPDVLPAIIRYLSEKGGQVGAVFATTGYCSEDQEAIQRISEKAPVIRSSNFSYGVNTMRRILEFAAPLLSDCSDIEIVEKHHNLKADAPSGTALMLADACDPQGKRERICGREGESKRRGEIGIHSVRAGTIFGEHSVIFALKDEVIEVRHTAYSKTIFARGAIEAALWLAGRKPGFYSAEDVFY